MMKIDLSTPQVMGILNVTPDSHSDGGRYILPAAALQHAEQMIKEGATIIDVGGESTRPGAQAVSVQEELDRVIPVIELLHQNLPVVLSIDTRHAAVMKAAISAGTSFINDVYALQDEGALEIVAAANVSVCLMHMKGEPATMQVQPHYEDVVSEVKLFLQQRVQACLAMGIARENIIVDPGFGFGKTAQHNLILLKHLKELTHFDGVGDVPVLACLSRKVMFKVLLDLAVNDRLAPSIALAAIAVMNGASIIRAHDVKATVEAVRISSLLMKV